MSFDGFPFDDQNLIEEELQQFNFQEAWLNYPLQPVQLDEYFMITARYCPNELDGLNQIHRQCRQGYLLDEILAPRVLNQLVENCKRNQRIEIKNCSIRILALLILRVKEQYEKMISDIFTSLMNDDLKHGIDLIEAMILELNNNQDLKGYGKSTYFIEILMESIQKIDDNTFRELGTDIIVSLMEDNIFYSFQEYEKIKAYIRFILSTLSSKYVTKHEVSIKCFLILLKVENTLSWDLLLYTQKDEFLILVIRFLPIQETTLQSLTFINDLNLKQSVDEIYMSLVNLEILIVVEKLIASQQWKIRAAVCQFLSNLTLYCPQIISEFVSNRNMIEFIFYLGSYDKDQVKLFALDLILCLLLSLEFIKQNQEILTVKSIQLLNSKNREIINKSGLIIYYILCQLYEQGIERLQMFLISLYQNKITVSLKKINQLSYENQISQILKLKQMFLNDSALSQQELVSIIIHNLCIRQHIPNLSSFLQQKKNGYSINNIDYFPLAKRLKFDF